MSCIADHGLPHSPDSGFPDEVVLLDTCPLVDRVNEEVGSEVTLRRDLPATAGVAAGVGELFLEVNLEPFLLAASSLPSVA